MDPSSRRKLWDVLSAIRAKQSSIVLTTHSMEEAEALCTRIAIMVSGKLRCLGTPQHLKSKFGDGFELEVKLRTPTPAELAAVGQQRLVGSSSGSSSSSSSSSSSKLSQAEINKACAEWGRPDWAGLVTEKGSGATLWSLLRDGGRVPRATVVEWLVAEEGAGRLDAFLREQFGAGVKLIERASWFTYRFSLPVRAATGEGGEGGVGGGGLSLADMFERLEAGKVACGIVEYALGETQIEVIFNRLCAEGQREEEEEAREAEGEEEG
jgi:hypothetical protein